MNLTRMLGVFLTAMLWLNILQSQTIFINEFMASNSTIVDEFGEFDDWVEIYNPGATPFDLGGKYVTDDLTVPTKWQIPTTNPSLTTVPAGGYLILWFDGTPTQGELHVDPKLGSGGEQIGIYDADGTTPLDTLTYGPQTTDVSEGRFPDGSASFVTFTNPTPGLANEPPIVGQVEAPVASTQGGHYNSSLQISFSSSTADALIYYTNDGSDPTESSMLYSGPISINNTQVIRVRAFKSGLAPSDIITNSYFINVNHVFPIVAFSADPDKFFGEENGMFPNFEEDIEVPINVEFYETDGTQGFNQVAEVELHGSASASLPQKSLAIKAKGSLGGEILDYPVFPDEPFTHYRSLILRNSGQDWEYTMFRDAMESSLIRDLSDLDVTIETPDVDQQAYRPVIAFINGEYWGIYNLRERYDWRYLKVHYGLDDTQVDLLENNDDIKEGDFVEWNRLDSLLQAKSFANAAGLSELGALVDLDNYRDYVLFNIFIDNVDWPGNNFRRWRERTPSGKWRWMVKDLDFSFGLLEIDGGFNTGNFNVNSIDRMLNYNGFPTISWSTRLFRKLMENPVWKQDFINRTADQLNVLYPTQRMLQRIDDFQATYQPEINQHNQMWNNVWTWNQDIDVLRTFAGGRTEAMRNHYVTSISEITGTSEVTLNASPTNGGEVKINTITTSQNNFPWTGTYFNGIPVPIQAIPNPGFVFVGWSSNVSGGPSTTVTLNGDIEITAIFASDNGGPIDQTIDFPPISDKSVSAAPFTISATASSGLPVSFSIVSGPASIVGNTITLDGVVGTVTVMASQAGNAQYNPAPDVTQSFMVTDSGPIDQTIDFPPISDKSVSAAPFTISATASSGLPVSFSIVSGPASIVGNTITLDGVVGTVTVMASQAGNTQYNPAPDVTQSFVVFDDPPTGNYCDSKGISPWEEYIANVSFGSINNTSEKNQYGNFTSQSTTVQKGNIYPIQLTPGFSWAHYNEVFAVWIDWNQDKDFDDAGEKVFTTTFSAGVNGSIPSPVSGSVNVPSNAAKGTTRMRVIMQRDQEASPCGTFNLGETEDYSILVEDGGTGSNLQITCPQHISLSVPAGTGGTTVNWNEPVVTSDCPSGVNSAVQTGGAPNGSFFNIGTYIIEYAVSDNCGNNATCSFIITISEESSGVYCNSKGNSPWEEYIANVNFGSINNTSEKNQYGNFTSQSTTVQKGNIYPIQLTPGFSWAHYNEVFAVWIDWNQDKDFDDAGEKVFAATSSAGANGSTPNPVSGSINVPSGAATGTTRMRVIMQRDQEASPCGTFNLGETEDYSILVEDGGTGSNLQITCPQHISLSVPAGTGGTTVNWDEPVVTSDCPSGVNSAVQTGGAPNGSFFNIGTYIIEYAVSDNCGNNATCSFIITISEESSGVYCNSKGNSPWEEYIANVNFGSINNTSEKNQYGNFTSQSTTVQKGNTYPIQLTPGFSWAHYNEVFAVWIDWNQDKDFDDAGEKVFTATSSAGANGSIPSPVSGSVNVPSNAAKGTTRMRVIMQRDQEASPCGTFNLGETEDYSVQVINGNAANRNATYLNFTAFNTGRAVELQWLTNMVEESESFTIERSTDGVDFIPLKNSHQMPDNNRADVFFKEIDENPFVGANYYRLRQTLKDGRIHFSLIHLVEFENNLYKIKLFPNPAKDVLHLQLKELAGEKGNIQLFDTYGKLHWELAMEAFPTGTLAIPLQGFFNGLYYLKIQRKNKKPISKKVIISRFY